MNNPTRPAVAVFDGLLRAIHWWNALSITGLLATGLAAEEFEHGPLPSALWQWHISLGYALIGGLAARLLWGLVGPATARWTDLWHPAAWREIFRTRQLPKPRAGHDPLASLAFIGLYLTLASIAATGLALAAIEYERGPLAAWSGDAAWLKEAFKEPHEALYLVVAGFVGLHLAALVFHAWRGHSVAGAMIGGDLHVDAGEVRHA